MRRIFSFLVVCLCLCLSIRAQSIVGSWRLTWLLIEGDMAYSIVAPVTLSIQKNGRISGNGGCNSFSGSFAFKQPKKFKKAVKIKFGDILSTEMFCDRASNTEKAFFRSLREAATVFIIKGELQIKSPKIGNAMHFVTVAKP